MQPDTMEVLEKGFGHLATMLSECGYEREREVCNPLDVCSQHINPHRTVLMLPAGGMVSQHNLLAKYDHDPNDASKICDTHQQPIAEQFQAQFAETQFIFVPGMHDPSMPLVLPRPPLPEKVQVL